MRMMATGPAAEASASGAPGVTDAGPLRILDPDGELLDGQAAPLPDTEALQLYRAMVRNRVLDERMVGIQRQGRIGFYIGSIGEEASIIGPVAALAQSDWLFPCYRENGGYLLRGMPLQALVDNLFGNGNDSAIGRQMPNHIAWREAKITSVSSPIGTQIPQAVGAAFAAKKRGRPDATMVFFGDGATSSNDFHTGMNFAGVWKAPVVFVCRNNGWAISVPLARQTAAPRLVDKALGYGVAGAQVDGNDLFACYRVAKEALARARRGEGPTLIEALTYRMGGHSTSDDPKVYRPEALLEPWKGKDPLERVRRYLVAQGTWSDAEDQELRRRIDDECKEAIAVAEKTPPPPLESMFEGVFRSMPWHLAEELGEARRNAGSETGAEGAFPL